MSDVSPSAADWNKRGVEFVIIELDAALTFLDVADNSRIVETKERNHLNARKAYDTVVGLLEKLLPDAVQQAEIDLRLQTLRDRLIAAGQRV